MDKPDISDDFTVEDIHKIREYHYELTKNMTLEEEEEFYKVGAEEAEKKIDKIRLEKQSELYESNK